MRYLIFPSIAIVMIVGICFPKIILICAAFLCIIGLYAIIAIPVGKCFGFFGGWE